VTTAKLALSFDGYYTWLSGHTVAGPNWTELTDSSNRYRPLSVTVSTPAILDISYTIGLQSSGTGRAAVKVLVDGADVGVAFTNASQEETVSFRTLQPVAAGVHTIQLFVGSWDTTTVHAGDAFIFNVIAYGR
jgi:anti-sigma-K factor RskA